MSVKQTVVIEGMGCDHCVKAVREAIEGLDGIRATNVEIGKAVVESEKDDAINMAEVEKAIEEAGYTVSNQ